LGSNNQGLLDPEHEGVKNVKVHAHVIERVNASNNSSRCLFIGEIMCLTKMSVILLANYHATTQHSHSVITDFHDLQILPCRANCRLTHIPYRIASPKNLGRDATSGYPSLTEPPSVTQIGPDLWLQAGLHRSTEIDSEDE
jgi:hypothetical protein